MAVYIDGQRRDQQLNMVRDREPNEQHLDLERVGYDADNETYTYRDSSTREYFAGEQGNRYGSVHPQDNIDPPRAPPPRWSEYPPPRPSPSFDRYPTWRYFAPFAVIILVVLGLLLRYVGTSGDGPAMTWPKEPLKCQSGLEPYTIVKGDTCWSIAEESGKTVEDLYKANDELDCDKLIAGKQICIWA